MDVMIMIAQILLSLSILVGLHEMGHLLAAKAFGMRVEKFSIGFPPKIFGFKWGETEYALSAIPLGGFVKISGMIDESLDTEAMNEEPKEYEFRAKPAWQRLIVMLGGIIVNVILGVTIFILMTYFLGTNHVLNQSVNQNGGIQVGEIGKSIGLETGDQIIKVNGESVHYFFDARDPNVFLEDNASYTVLRNGVEKEISIPEGFLGKLNKVKNPFALFMYRYTSEIAGLPEKGKDKYLSHKLQLKKGDKVIEINGAPIVYFDEISSTLKDYDSDSISFKVDRAGEILSFNEFFRPYNNHIGIAPGVEEIEKEHIDYSFGASINKGTADAFGAVYTQIKAFKSMIQGKLNPTESLGGPIAIAEAFGSEWNWERFWRLTGLLSMILAFMNLLPIPALDGGHVVFLTAEMVSGRKPSDKFLEGAQKVGMVILLLLMVFIFGNDIINLVTRLLA